MTFEITEREREILSEILKSAHTSLIDELHHTESYDYKQMLRRKEEILEGLRAKIEGSAAGDAVI